MCLTNLGDSLYSRLDHLCDTADLDEATTTHQQSVRLVPHSHPRKPTLHNNLGNSLGARLEHLGDIADADEAIAAHQRADHLTPMAILTSLNFSTTSGSPSAPGLDTNLTKPF